MRGFLDFCFRKSLVYTLPCFLPVPIIWKAIFVGKNQCRQKYSESSYPNIFHDVRPWAGGENFSKISPQKCNSYKSIKALRFFRHLRCTFRKPAFRRTMRGKFSKGEGSWPFAPTPCPLIAKLIRTLRSYRKNSETHFMFVRLG